MICGNCRQTITSMGAPHSEEIKEQYECPCGNIETVLYSEEELERNRRFEVDNAPFTEEDKKRAEDRKLEYEKTMSIFPIIVAESDSVDSYGLTKREHFAGLALQGIMANSRPEFLEMPNATIAKWAVTLADNLIVALNQKGEKTSDGDSSGS